MNHAPPARWPRTLDRRATRILRMVQRWRWAHFSAAPDYVEAINRAREVRAARIAEVERKKPVRKEMA